MPSIMHGLNSERQQSVLLAQGPAAVRSRMGYDSDDL